MENPGKLIASGWNSLSLLSVAMELFGKALPQGKSKDSLIQLIQKHAERNRRYNPPKK